VADAEKPGEKKVEWGGGRSTRGGQTQRSVPSLGGEEGGGKHGKTWGVIYFERGSEKGKGESSNKRVSERGGVSMREREKVDIRADFFGGKRTKIVSPVIFCLAYGEKGRKKRRTKK